MAVVAIRGLKIARELASHYQIHPVRISQWKKQTRESLDEIFQSGQGHRTTEIAIVLTAPSTKQLLLNWLTYAMILWPNKKRKAGTNSVYNAIILILPKPGSSAKKAQSGDLLFTAARWIESSIKPSASVPCRFDLFDDMNHVNLEQVT